MPQGNGGVVGPANDPTTSTASGVWGLKEHAEAVGAGEWPAFIGSLEISRSLRFNSADSATLNRTPATAGNRKQWTFSVWLKRGAISANYSTIFGCGPNSNEYFLVWLHQNNYLQIQQYAGGTHELDLYTDQLFRDVSAWLHLVIAVDTDQSTAANRIKIYVNGDQITNFSSASYPSQGSSTRINDTVDHRIGTINVSYVVPTYCFNGLMAEINFVDGQALTPSDFGETDSITGVWKPKAYTGTYGTNGFHLDFSDNSGTTSTTLGADSSGNGNNWTPNNFSVTAGAGNDSLVDTPTPYGTDTGAGGEVRGNYATLNPLITPATMTIVNGNLDLSGYTPFTSAYGTLGIPTTGKWYFEFIVQANAMIGIAGTPNGSQYPGQASDAYAWDADNSTTYNSGSTASYGSSAPNDVVGCAFDADAGTLVFYTNGVSQGTAFSSIPSKTYFPVFRNGNSVNTSVNFGQRPFAYTAPSGFKALCTTNLPDPTVVQGDDYFNTVLWTGDGTGNRSITGVGFQPDFVWVKARNQALKHTLYDGVRGSGKSLTSSDTAAEVSNDAEGYINSFDSDGFGTLNGGTSNERFNASGYTYAAWNWNAGGSNATNTDGTITSTVRANPTAGISVVSWTYGGAATIGHGLNATPKMMIVKGRNAVYNWDVYHASLGATGRLVLNSNAAFATTSGPWNNTAPTSTVFSQGAAWYSSGDSLIGYMFAEVPGFSAFGSYTGNGSTDGPFIYTGFRPAFVMFKGSSASPREWIMQDIKRQTYNAAPTNAYNLGANSSVAENDAGVLGGPSNANNIDWLSNGFKIRYNNGNCNASGGTYIFAAFAENPFKYALAR